MFSHAIFCLLLAIVSLCGTASTTPLPALEKRYECDRYIPGGVLTSPSTTALVGCYQYPTGVSLFFQEDANLVMYNNSNHGALWASNTGGRSCSGNNCTLAFQKDGNFVIYFNRVPIWYTGTGADIGQWLYVQNMAPYLYVLNSAGGVAWQS